MNPELAKLYPSLESLDSWLQDNIDGASEIFFEEKEDGSRVDSDAVQSELMDLMMSFEGAAAICSRTLTFLEVVAAGNTEPDRLAEMAQEILDEVAPSDA